MPVHKGSCHCGGVQFEFDAPSEVSMTDCNCSICYMTGYQHVFVGRSDFRITNGQENLLTYTFNTGEAKHMFCQTCGIKAFYVPKSHPDGYSVNLRCITPGTLTVSKTIPFDGRNWEDNIAGLKKDTES